MTKYADIAKWWEVICWTFLLVSLQAIPPYSPDLPELSICQAELTRYLVEHPSRDVQQGWKSMLNNMQLLLLPLLAFQLIKPWLTVFDNSLLVKGFNTLITLVNLSSNALIRTRLTALHSFSSS